MLQIISVPNKCGSFEHSIHRLMDHNFYTFVLTVFNIDNNKVS